MRKSKKWVVELSPNHKPTKRTTVWTVVGPNSSAYVARDDAPPTARAIAQEIRWTLGRGVPKELVDRQVADIQEDHARVEWPQWSCTVHRFGGCYHIKAVQEAIG